VISRVTNRGKVRLMFYEVKINTRKFIDFMKRLIKDFGRKILLRVDNLKLRHADIVSQYLAWPEIIKRIELFSVAIFTVTESG